MNEVTATVANEDDLVKPAVNATPEVAFVQDEKHIGQEAVAQDQ